MIVDLGPLTIKLDVLLVQFINIALLFWIFKKLFGDTLVQEIAKRRAMTKRLEQADKEYQSLLDQANEERKSILDEALAHKQQILDEAKALAHQEQKKLLDQAAYDADAIVQKAKQEAELKARDLDNNFVSGVKAVSLSLIKKLFGTNTQVQDSYLETLVEEFSSSYKK